MKSLTRARLVQNAVKILDLSPAKSALLLETMINTLKQGVLNGESLRLKNVGCLSKVYKEARPGRNPRVPEELHEISARWVVRFGKPTSTVINQSEWIERVLTLAQTYIKTCAEEVESFVKLVIKSIFYIPRSGGRLELRGFGTFKAVVRKAYTGHNPLTLTPVGVKEKTMLKFHASPAFNLLVNGGAR